MENIIDIVFIGEADWDIVEEDDGEDSSEYDGLELNDDSMDAVLDTLEELLLIEVAEYDTVDVLVNVAWSVDVVDFEGLNVGRIDADKDACDVEVLETDTEAVFVLDFKGVTLWLGESEADFEIYDVIVGLTVIVAVFDIELELDTEFVELELSVELWELLLLVETDEDIDGDEAEEPVEDTDIVSLIVWEEDPV